MFAEAVGHKHPRITAGHTHPGTDAPAKCGRRQTGVPAKQGAEAAQGREAYVKAYFRHRPAGNREQLAGALQTKAREKGVGRFAKGVAESTQKMPRRELGLG